MLLYDNLRTIEICAIFCNGHFLFEGGPWAGAP